MWKLFSDKKGAVTVFVTLLLVPAVLVSGSAVDIARIYTANSILQDAEDLTANALLSDYDALLQDLYGLYGISLKEPELGNLIDKYMKAAVFSDNEDDTSPNLFKLFYGSGLDSGSFEAQKDLGDIDVLRRQIEEYSKFRAPVIIIEDLVEIIEQCKKTKADSEAIEKKIEIDEDVEDLNKLYKEIYEKIQEADETATEEALLLAKYDELNRDIQTQISALNDMQMEYWEVKRDQREYEDSSGGDEDEDTAYAPDYESRLNDLRDHYDAVVTNLNHMVKGGYTGSVWSDGRWQNPRDKYYYPVNNSDYYKFNDGEYKNRLSNLVNKCKEADRKKRDIKGKIDELRQKLNSGECSEQLSDSSKDNSMAKDLEKYEALLKYNYEDMANAMKAYDSVQIDNFKEALSDLCYQEYGDVTKRISYDDIADIEAYNPSNNAEGFKLEYIEGNDNNVSRLMNEKNTIWASNFNLRDYSFGDSGVCEAYEYFSSRIFDETKNFEFYRELEELMQNSGADDNKKSSVINALKAVQSYYQNFMNGFSFDTEGASYYRVQESSETAPEESSFGYNKNWGDDKGATTEMKDSVNNGLLSKLATISNALGNKILLTTYCTNMFSCFTTADEEDVNSHRVSELEKTMSGIPMSKKVNYFFQSEQEYLFNGKQESAAQNLAAVAGMIFLVRLVMDYVSSYSIPFVNQTVEQAIAASSVTGPFAPAIGALVRLLLSAGEAAIDTVNLRSGKRVPLMKTDSPDRPWIFQPSGIEQITEDVIKSFEGRDVQDDSSGLSYENYLYMFLLLKDGDEMARRAADLIGFNLTNYKNGINADEERMSGAEQIKLSDMVTDFKFETKATMRMLFLSLSYAQNGVRGVRPPGSMDINHITVRGY